MAYGNTVSIDALRPEIFARELFADSIADLYFMKQGLMGKDKNNIVQLVTDLQKEPGDTWTTGLTLKLGHSGVTGDDELEGNEEIINAYSESVTIDQLRKAVRLTGKLDEQKNGYSMRADAKEKLQMWRTEVVERMLFLKLAGVCNTSLTDVDGNVVGTLCSWSNTPDYIPDADENAGYGKRYLCADYSAGTTSLATTDLLTPALLRRLHAKAKTASPKILPLRVDGKNYYIVFIHPWQGMDLKSNAEFQQALREADIRGKENRIFTGALGIYDNLILYEHEYVPFLDVSVAGNSFRSKTAGTDCANDCFRAILCGRQAAAYVECSNPNLWVEETKDYKNKTGFSTSIMGGIQKLMFNSREYGVVVLDTSATALV